MHGTIFVRPDGRIVKLFLFSTLLDKSPLTSIYFATFEKKTEVRSPLPTQSKFLVFGKLYTIHYTIYIIHCIVHFFQCRPLERRMGIILKLAMFTGNEALGCFG